MSALSDTITLGLVLILVFGSACLYLYTRIQQSETKINLLESILLDLKMSNELKAYPPIIYPANDDETHVQINGLSETTLAPFVDVHEEQPMKSSDLSQSSPVSEAKRSIKPFVDQDDTDPLQEIITQQLHNASSTDDDTKSMKMNVNYEALTLKELQDVAKQRGITKISALRRAELIKVLKNADETHVNVLDALHSDNHLSEPIQGETSSLLETSDSIQPSPNVELAVQ